MDVERTSQVRAEIGDVAPDFALPTLEGDQVSLRSLSGRWVILFTWGSW